MEQLPILKLRRLNNKPPHSRDFSRGRIHNKAVKKTLSIPSCPNDMAERADINFSGVLQEALKANLNIG